MAAMTTVLTEFSTLGNSRTMTIPASHTVTRPRLVIQKRKVAEGNATVAEDSISVVYATEDSAGDLLSSKVAFTANVRRPVSGIAADVTSSLAVFRDIVASDEFANMVDSQEYVA